MKNFLYTSKDSFLPLANSYGFLVLKTKQIYDSHSIKCFYCIFKQVE